MKLNKNTDLQIMYKVRKTVITTLLDRGYKIPVGVSKLPIEDFRLLWEKNRHHLYFPELSPPKMSEDLKKGGGILVYFESSDDFTKKILESRISQLTKEYPNLDMLFFILKTYGVPKKKLKLNTFVVSALAKYPNVSVLENVYPYDFMKNALVPECHLLTEQEKEAVLKLYETPLHTFPKFEIDDPIPKRFGAKVDDLFYIKRQGGSEVSFRVVVKTGST